MLITLLNFGCVFLSTFLAGFAVLQIWRKADGKEYLKPDIILVCGLMAVTVYAEFFSIIYHVGTLTALMLAGICLCILIICRKKIWTFLIDLYHNKCFYPGIIIIVLLVFAGIIIASQAPDFYDTGLYHAQAIHWIENYGCVKGLGNLHNRFAYNSSFLCLQALYSWSFCLNTSLHGMNAYIAVVMCSYAVISFRFFRVKEEMVADALNVAILVYCGYSVSMMSSPNTDFFAMCLLLYILSRWFRCKSAGEKGILCVLAVFGVTVKLSIATLVLIAICPVYDLIKQRKWKVIICGLLCGSVTVLPFLIRNIIISGYLIYPYAFLDFFPVDWKMPAYTADFDRREIIAWGRGLNDVYRYEIEIGEWFPAWFRALSIIQQVLLWVNVALFVFLMIQAWRSRKKKEDWIFIFVIAVIGLLTWFFSAPLMRYGRVYLYLIPAIFAGVFLQKVKNGHIVGNVAAAILCFMMLIIGWQYVGSIDYVNMRTQEDYPAFSSSPYMLGEEFISVSEDGDRSGYEPFPMIPYKNRLELIELRGNTLKEGFRIKDEYLDTNITTYGTLDE